ncbi:MAG: hypothetical protein OCD02_00870 [Spirochaetaceae bacterium]
MKKNKIVIYSILAYLWSYTLWVFSIKYALQKDISLFLNESLVNAIYNKELIGDLAFFSLLAVAATLGLYLQV